MKGETFNATTFSGKKTGFLLFYDLCMNFICRGILVTGASYLTRNAIIVYLRTYKQVYNFMTF